MCTGHVLSSWQHAIRASGVACQPAHIARFPTPSVRTAAIAASRRLKLTTYVGCWRERAVSNRDGLKVTCRRSARYTRTVMRTIAVILALIFTAIASTDPLYCSDGCTRGGLALTQHAQTGSDCPICQPGAVAISPSRLVASTAVVSAPLSPEQAVIDSFPSTIEHPPRRTA